MDHDEAKKPKSEEERTAAADRNKKQPSQENPHTSADQVLAQEPEGKHFNEGITPREPQQGNHLGATEDDVVPITAPEITDEKDKSEVEEEMEETIEENMTGG